MEISLHSEVHYSDGLRGQTTSLVIDLEPRRVTHIVVMEDRLPHSEHLVPFNQIAQTTPELIHLRCTRHGLASVEGESIPPGELALGWGAVVEASDGPVGRVDEFIVDDQSGNIIQMVLREGHLWDHKEVIIPVSQFERIEADAVYLNMDKESVSQLLVIPL